MILFGVTVGGREGGGHQEEGGDATGLTCCEYAARLPRPGCGEQVGTAVPQMMVGTLPLLLFRLLFLLDRLGVAMSTKRSSGQPYCSSTSMHSWLEACRA